MSAPALEPTILQIKDHAKRHQDSRPAPELVKALGLTSEQAAQLYITDTQSYSNGCHVSQLHYLATDPSPEVQKYRGVAYMTNSISPNEYITVCKSYPYEEPIVSSSFPAGFENAKFSKSRQGFVARVYCPFGDVNISTHRKIDCAKSRFGQSIFMKDMFTLAATAKGLDVKALFRTVPEKRMCHVFFVEHKDMRMIPVADAAECNLVYLGSMKQDVPNWADEDDDDIGNVVVHDMIPCHPAIPALEALRPQYYPHEEAVILHAAGVPLVAWEDDKAPTRLVPCAWDRKEKLRGNVPNLKLAWYTLMDEGKEHELKEVLEESQHHLLAEYQLELETMLDSTAANHTHIKPPAKGSLVDHLLERYTAYMACTDKADFLLTAGKATGPVLKTMEAYGRKIAPDQRRMKLTKLVRRLGWEQLEAKKVYTLISEFKRFIAPPIVRNAVEVGNI